jgi:transcriptional regulator with XRE-family HTH domain
MKNNDLGTFLRTARELKQLSLRGVEKAIGISNAYLSQIESGKISQPSPNILHKLCELYEIPYSDVMRLAGYPIPDENDEKGTRSGLPPSIGSITEEEEEALIEYLAFLRSRRSRKE